MKYVDKLLEETAYQSLLKRLALLEQDRSFCRHDLGHLLDTARIAWCYWMEAYLQKDMEQPVQETEFLENGEPLSGEKLLEKKELLYLAALLHDLGRIREYEAGIPHEQAGIVIAEELLVQIQYPEKMRNMILDIIGEHRGTEEALEQQEEKPKNLKTLLRWADKRSRNCFFCKASNACKWPKEKRNRRIEY